MHCQSLSFAKSSRLLRLALPLVMTALLCLCLAIPGAGAQETGLENLRRTGEAFRAVTKKVSPAVVFIKVEKKVEASGAHAPFAPQGPFGEDFFRRFFGFPAPPGHGPHHHDHNETPQHRVMGQGSGFIVSQDGYVLTNNHVVGDADKVTVRLEDEREFEARIVGTDPASDVAVLKIAGENLPVLALGDSDALGKGDWVLAVGNPFGLSGTLTAGIVSAKGRSGIGIADYENFIQTDAAINPGNSGGPLVDLSGNVVGMNTAIFSRSGGYMGIGFAIPINMVKIIKEQIVANGSVTRGYMGVITQDLTPALAESFGLEDTKGVLISQVTRDSAADAAGLRQGDVIVAFAGEPVDSAGALRNRVALDAPGTRTTMKVIREKKPRTLEITLGTLEQKQVGATANEQNEQRLGLSVTPLTPELASRFGYSGEQGLLITGIEAGSPAERAGLRQGALILEANRQPVTTATRLYQALQQGEGKAALLLVRRGETTRYVAIEFG